MSSKYSDLQIGDRVNCRSRHGEGVVVNIYDYFEDEDGDEVEEGEGEYQYTEVRVAFDNGQGAYFTAEECERIETAASFVPEDWS